MESKSNDLRKRIKWSGISDMLRVIADHMEKVPFPSFDELRDDELEELINSLNDFNLRVEDARGILFLGRNHKCLKLAQLTPKE